MYALCNLLTHLELSKNAITYEIYYVTHFVTSWLLSLSDENRAVSKSFQISKFEF